MIFIQPDSTCTQAVDSLVKYIPSITAPFIAKKHLSKLDCLRFTSPQVSVRGAGTVQRPPNPDLVRDHAQVHIS